MRRKLLLDALHILPFVIAIQLFAVFAVHAILTVGTVALAVALKPPHPDLWARAIGSLLPFFPAFLTIAGTIAASLVVRIADAAVANSAPMSTGARFAWVLGILFGPSLVAQIFWWGVARRRYVVDQAPPAASAVLETEVALAMPPCDDEWEQIRTWIDPRPASGSWDVHAC